MDSHTVPRFLLDQFAYDDPVKRSRRLWQYAKGRAPWPFASPKTATRIPGHFADPVDEKREAEIETRLNHEIENPVHQFLPFLGNSMHEVSPRQIGQLARYVALLFVRSSNRRGATKQQLAMAIESVRRLMKDKAKISRVAARWTSDFSRMGIDVVATVTTADVCRTCEKMIGLMQTEAYEQTTYVDSVERAMHDKEEVLEGGAWNLVHTDVEFPFVIGDSPVATWRRSVGGKPVFGQGIETEDVEVLLPISSTKCLHILPAVQRSQIALAPTMREVNRAQAAFAMKYCYAHKHDAELDYDLQSVFQTVAVGMNALTLRQQGYDDLLFEGLVSGWSRFVRPLR